ncbi:MAG: cysteine desulfurase [Candidatus Caenarcaniphilales bacterium]|nr:cysteine desulfurase [Candidatus Caenarcaniphilales bacterium]
MLTKTNQEPINAQEVIKDFPILNKLFNGKKLVYLDNGATTQKPKVVIDRIADYLANENSTVRRGVYYLSEKSTFMFDETRRVAANFVNASRPEEIIFTRGCTEAVNLVASSLGGSILKPGDQVQITQMEHHANIVPWQLICEAKGAELKVAPINQDGELILEDFQKLLSEKTKIVSLTHISNVLGTINPIKQIIEMSHKVGAKVFIDGAQGAPHELVNVQDLDCDFYCFSGHKIYGPTGVGVLYGKYEVLEQMPPYMSGGDMIDLVTFEKTTFAAPPARFEAGTPQIAEVIALKEALEYVKNLGIEKIKAYEDSLLEYATEKLQEIQGLRIFGNAANKASLISFVLEDAHAHDIGTILDHEDNICIRVGHHCAQPLMKIFNVSATARASFAFYNTKEDVDKLFMGLKKVQSLFG